MGMHNLLVPHASKVIWLLAGSLAFGITSADAQVNNTCDAARQILQGLQQPMVKGRDGKWRKNYAGPLMIREQQKVVDGACGGVGTGGGTTGQNLGGSQYGSGSFGGTGAPGYIDPYINQQLQQQTLGSPFNALPSSSLIGPSNQASMSSSDDSYGKLDSASKTDPYFISDINYGVAHFANQNNTDENRQNEKIENSASLFGIDELKRWLFPPPNIPLGQKAIETRQFLLKIGIDISVERLASEGCREYLDRAFDRRTTWLRLATLRAIKDSPPSNPKGVINNPGAESLLAATEKANEYVINEKINGQEYQNDLSLVNSIVPVADLMVDSKKCW